MSNFNCFTHNGISIPLNESAEYHARNCYEINTHTQVQFTLLNVRKLLKVSHSLRVDSDLIVSIPLKGKYRDLQHYAKILGIPATLPSQDLAFILLSIK